MVLQVREPFKPTPQVAGTSKANLGDSVLPPTPPPPPPPQVPPTFAGAGSDESRRLAQVVVDLHISSKHNQGFDQLDVVHLSNKRLSASHGCRDAN